MARRRSGKKIDFVHWAGLQFNFSALAAGVGGGTLSPAQHDPETLLRIRGNWYAYADGAGAPSRLALLTMGIIIVPEGTGTTVLWSPFTDPDAPWIWTDCLAIGQEEQVVDALSVQAIAGVQRTVDNKAMRIVRNQELQIVVENTTLAGAISINTGFAGRVLSGT